MKKHYIKGHYHKNPKDKEKQQLLYDELVNIFLECDSIYGELVRSHRKLALALKDGIIAGEIIPLRLVESDSFPFDVDFILPKKPLTNSGFQGRREYIIGEWDEFRKENLKKYPYKDYELYEMFIDKIADGNIIPADLVDDMLGSDITSLRLACRSCFEIIIENTITLE